MGTVPGHGYPLMPFIGTILLIMISYVQQMPSIKADSFTLSSRDTVHRLFLRSCAIKWISVLVQIWSVFAVTVTYRQVCNQKNLHCSL